MGKFDYTIEDRQTCIIGGLRFYVKNLKCPKCGYDYSSDPQYVYELYLEMEAQSKQQGETQCQNYVDVFKRANAVCDKCSCRYVERVEFRKVFKGVWVTAWTYPIEQDVVYIATHTKIRKD